MEIGWCHTQGNVVLGSCPFRCELTNLYRKNRCYGHTQDVRYKRQNRQLKLNLKEFDKWKKLKPSRIFPNSTMELFHISVLQQGEETGDWLYRIFSKMQEDQYNKHAYIVLTKLPENAFNFFFNFKELRYIENLMLVTSVTSCKYEFRISQLKQVFQKHKGISFEPLIGRPFLTYRPLDEIEWVLVGGLSHAHRCIKAHEPKEEWVDSIIDQSLISDASVYIKHNAFFNWDINHRRHVYNCKEVPEWMP